MLIRVTVLLLVMASVLATLTSCNAVAEKAAQNKLIVQQAFDVMNGQDFDKLREFIGETYQRHCQATPDVQVTDFDSFIALVREWYTAFPDAVQTVHLLAAEGDLVAFYATFEGTHLAPMNGIPATGKKVVSETFGFHRLENGRIVETWVTWDNVAVLSQLGQFPPAAQEKP